MKILILFFCFCLLITKSYSQTTSQDSAFNERISKYKTSDADPDNYQLSRWAGLSISLQYNNGAYVPKSLETEGVFIQQQIYQELKAEYIRSFNTFFDLNSGNLQKNNMYIFEFSYGSSIFDKSLSRPSIDDESGPQKNIGLYNIIGKNRIGYAWISNDIANLSLFTGRGLGGAINSFKKNTIDWQSSEVFERFEIGAQISISRNWKINAVKSYSMYHSATTLAFLSNNIVNLGGAYLLDAYLTDYLIKNKVPFVPLIQTIYQSAFNFLLYSLRKDNFLAPLPIENKSVSGIPNEEYSIGVVYINQ